MAGLVTTQGPWEIPGALYFYAGRFSNFAGVDGLILPGAWYGHPTPAPMYEVRSIEHYMHAVKAQNQADFEWVLAATSPRQAKQRGGPDGERQSDGSIRKIALRPDWDTDITVGGLTGPTKLHVVIYALRQRAKVDHNYAEVLALTGDAILVEDSPRDFEWGGRNRFGGFTGRNLLGIAHMAARAELAVRTAEPADRLLIDGAGLSLTPKLIKGCGGAPPQFACAEHGWRSTAEPCRACVTLAEANREALTSPDPGDGLLGPDGELIAGQCATPGCLNDVWHADGSSICPQCRTNAQARLTPWAASR